MKPETYKALLKDLQKLQKALVASQIAAVRQDRRMWARMEKLHAEAEVGGRVDDFVATAARWAWSKISCARSPRQWAGFTRKRSRSNRT